MYKDELRYKIEKTLNILRKAFDRFNKIGISWSTGKDSTLCLYFTRQIDPNLPVIFNDTFVHFPQTYQFRDWLAKEWSLNLHIARASKNRIEELRHDRELCCDYHKTKAFLSKIRELGLDAVIVGVRWSEHPARANEDYFSPREDHVRIHPILHWREEDVWQFIRKNKIPYNPLYSQGYRSIGCKPCTRPVPPTMPERAGRDKDKEEILRKLRELGYY